MGELIDTRLLDIRRTYLYCRAKGLPVDPHTAYVAIRSAGDYGLIRSTYLLAVHEVVQAYLSGAIGLAVAKGQFKRAMATAFVDAFETGWVEGSKSETYEPESDDTDWLASRTDAELGYIDSLFTSLKEVKTSASQEDPLTDADILDVAVGKSDGYARTLDGIYAQGKLRGARNIMLGLEGNDGNESCPTCQRYKGVYHRAKWWVAHELIPQPGNTNYECGGYRCEHQLVDRDGNVWAGYLG